MEAIGAASSIATLLELVGGIAKLIKFCSKYKKSKESIERVGGLLGTVTARLRVLKGVEKWAAAKRGCLQLDEELQALGIELYAAKNEILRLKEFCTTCSTQETSTVNRVKWVLKDSKAWDRLALRLQQAESMLTLTIQGLIIRTMEINHDQLQAKQDFMLDEMGALRKNLGDRTYRSTDSLANYRTAQTNDNFAKSEEAGLISTQGITKVYRSCFSKFRVHIVSERSEELRHTLRQLDFEFPCPVLGGLSVIKLKIALRTHIYDYPGIKFRIKIRNIIPRSSDIVKACEYGDINWVRSIFLRRAAQPNDMTDDRRPLLWYAIEGGSLEVVQYLLWAGSDATALSGSKNAGLLHASFYFRKVNIARVLVGSKADPDQVNDDGVAAPFHLFQPGRGQSSAGVQELLDIALINSVSVINIQSYEGWTSLHRVAAYGTDHDIDSFIERGADAALKTFEFQWTPLFVAVHFGNTMTFERLLHYSGAETVRDRDARGWTMLHEAAGLGNSELVSLLIAYGADVHAMSTPNPTLVSDNIYACRKTPLEVARYSGQRQFQNYILGLQNAKIDVYVDVEEDVFWSMDN